MNFTLLLSRLCNSFLNPFILMLAVFVFGLFCYSLYKLFLLRNRIDALLGTKVKSKTVTSREPKKIKSETVSESELNWDEFYEFCEQYQRDSISFTWFSSIIQIFPLLGILGTVAGLYFAMNSNQGLQNAQDLYTGVRLALSSTIYGIIAAVIFKFLDVTVNSYFINYIDDGIDRFKDKYNEEKGLPLGDKHQ